MNIQLIGLSAIILLLLHRNNTLLWLYHRNEHVRWRRWWVRPINRPKRAHGLQHNLYEEMLSTDHDEFYQTTRMWPEQFDLLVRLVEPYLRKRSIRRPLSVRTRLALTLSYLAQGDSVHSIYQEFRIGRSTAYAIIPETCRAIWTALQPLYLPFLTQQDWKLVSEGVFTKWQFPNCLGAIDGRHMRIQKPCLSGSMYSNYKGVFSMVLLASCDANYKFTWIDVGQYGSISDGGVWSRTQFATDLEAGEVDIPPPKPLPNREIPFPHVFVADEAFPLKSYLMRPYPRGRAPLADAQRIFNYRLSRARRIIENAFGILTARWQILQKPVVSSVPNAEAIFKALVCLHNVLMKDEENLPNNRRSYCPSDFVDRDNEEDGSWRTEGVATYFRRLGRVGANNAANVPSGMRNYLKTYLNSQTEQDQAPWQLEYALAGRNINEPGHVRR